MRVHVCGGNKLHTHTNCFPFWKVNKQDMKNCGKMQLDCRVNNNDGYYVAAVSQAFGFPK